MRMRRFQKRKEWSWWRAVSTCLQEKEEKEKEKERVFQILGAVFPLDGESWRRKLNRSCEGTFGFKGEEDSLMLRTQI